MRGPAPPTSPSCKCPTAPQRPTLPQSARPPNSPSGIQAEARPHPLPPPPPTQPARVRHASSDRCQDRCASFGLGDLAEGGGFEPPEACASTVFKTVAIVRSATPPSANLPARLVGTGSQRHRGRPPCGAILSRCTRRWRLVPMERWPSQVEGASLLRK